MSWLLTLVCGVSDVPSWHFASSQSQLLVRIGSSRRCTWCVQGDGVLPLHALLLCERDRLHIIRSRPSLVFFNGIDVPDTMVLSAGVLELGCAKFVLEEAPSSAPDATQFVPTAAPMRFASALVCDESAATIHIQEGQRRRAIVVSRADGAPAQRRHNSLSRSTPTSIGAAASTSTVFDSALTAIRICDSANAWTTIGTLTAASGVEMTKSAKGVDVVFGSLSPARCGRAVRRCDLAIGWKRFLSCCLIALAIIGAWIVAISPSQLVPAANVSSAKKGVGRQVEAEKAEGYRRGVVAESAKQVQKCKNGCSVEALERRAVDLLAAGDELGALVVYQSLSSLAPRPAFAMMVAELQSRKDKCSDMTSCAP